MSQTGQMESDGEYSKVDSGNANLTRPIDQSECSIWFSTIFGHYMMSKFPQQTAVEASNEHLYFLAALRSLLRKQQQQL